MERSEVFEVERILEKIRPALREHHGDLKVVRVEDGDVYLSFEGGCVDCPVVDESLKDMLDVVIKGNLDWVKSVKVVQSKYQII
ncbi:MAG: NifU family protein [Aquificaceae bacterium]|nr:NifU family protein [Aquificaceae bacterium]MDW8237089.1 NifU family protein [Aquificaceae bacterium]